MFDRVRDKIAGRLRSLADLPLPERLAPLQKAAARAADVVGAPSASASSASEPASTRSPAAVPPVAAHAAAAAKREGAHGELGDARKAAQVYGRKTDLWTSRVVDLLRQREVACELVELDDAESAGLDDRLVVETKQQRAPYVFLRGKFVGGFNQLDAIDRVGQLAERTAEPGAAPRPAPTRTKIVLLAGDDETPYGETR